MNTHIAQIMGEPGGGDLGGLHSGLSLFSHKKKVICSKISKVFQVDGSTFTTVTTVRENYFLAID